MSVPDGPTDSISGMLLIYGSLVSNVVARTKQLFAIASRSNIGQRMSQQAIYQLDNSVVFIARKHTDARC